MAMEKVAQVSHLQNYNILQILLVLLMLLMNDFLIGNGFIHFPSVILLSAQGSKTCIFVR